MKWPRRSAILVVFAHHVRSFFNQAKVPPRAAASLWERILGENVQEEMGEEQLKVWMEAREETLYEPERPPSVAGARKQLDDFMMEMRQKYRAGSNSQDDGAVGSTVAWRSPFANTFGEQTNVAAEPQSEDLRVPVRMGEPNMVHLAQ